MCPLSHLCHLPYLVLIDVVYQVMSLGPDLLNNLYRWPKIKYLCHLLILICLLIMYRNVITGADPGFQVRGVALKKIAPSGGRHENFWGISCEKSQFYAKKIIFFPILGGCALGAPPPAPDVSPLIVCKLAFIKNIVPRRTFATIGR